MAAVEGVFTAVLSTNGGDMRKYEHTRDSDGYCWKICQDNTGLYALKCDEHLDVEKPVVENGGHMSETKHTAGPWRNVNGSIVSPLGVHIATASKNDASLIAAAPDLLAALRDCSQYFHDFIEQDYEEIRLAATCRAVIAIACGD